MALEQKYALAKQTQNSSGRGLAEVMDLESLLEMYEDAQTDEDKAIYATYQALADGEHLVDINTALEKGGTNGLGPAVGIAPADAPKLGFVRRYSKVGARDSARFVAGHWSMVVHPYRVGFRTPISGRSIVLSATWKLETLTPPIPPKIRKTHDLDGKLVLFEVREWDQVAYEEKTFTPPSDPLLLEHVQGDFWRVIDQWDMSDLEVRVIAGVRGR